MSLNIGQLGALISEKRGTVGIRATAKDIGISPATLSRVENGNVPDLATFAAICRWLGEDPNRFLGMTPDKSTTEAVTVHLRKKKTTSVDTAGHLAEMILTAQRALRDLDNL